LDTASSGAMEQHFDRNASLKYMLNLFDEETYGYFAFDGNNLIGFMLASALEYDKPENPIGS
jgi:hypothetical protein